MGSLQQPVLTKGSAFPMKRSVIIGFPYQVKLKPCRASSLEGSLVTGRPPSSVSVPIPETGGKHDIFCSFLLFSCCSLEVRTSEHRLAVIAVNLLEGFFFKKKVCALLI